MPDIPVIGSALGGITGLFSQWMQARQQRRNIELQAQKNRELAQYQFDRQQQAVDQMNQYNAPAMQMQRMRDAGLNPNLIYGSPQKAGNQTETAKYQEQATNYLGQQPAFTGASIGNAVQTALSIKAQQIQNRKLEAEARQEEGKAIQIDWLNKVKQGTKLVESKDGKMVLKTTKSTPYKDRYLAQTGSVELQNDYNKVKNKLYSLGITNADPVAMRRLALYQNATGIDIVSAIMLTGDIVGLRTILGKLSVRGAGSRAGGTFKGKTGGLFYK